MAWLKGEGEGRSQMHGKINGFNFETLENFMDF